MAITYLLAPNPKWYIADLVGRPLGAGTMYTYRSLNKTQFKFVYQDPAGLFPWTDPILFDENGSQGPFYWAVDSTALNETYYIEVYDSAGVLQWTIDKFAPPGSGGGSIITTALDLQNLITNDVLWRNFGASANPIATTSILVAPGPHQGLAATSSLANPEIYFFKNNTNAIDQLQFIKFPVGSTPFGTADVTPVGYLNYTCGNSPAGETFKYVQFPITQGVQNLTKQAVSISIWARCNSGTSTLTLQWLQFFGDGTGASLPLVTPIQILNLTASWAEYVLPGLVVPDVSGNTLGACGNDGLFFQVAYPLGSTTNIDFIKPFLCLGNVIPDTSYLTNDMIEAVVNSPRTGDIRTSINNFTPFGWVFMDDGTIGSATSGATNRANIDTFPLYNQIWNSVINAWAPVTGGRGASAIADFSANKSIRLTRALGRVFAGTLNVEVSQSFTADFTTGILTVASTTSFVTGAPVSVANSGGALPSGLSASVTYYVINLGATTLRLATTAANAVAGTALSFSSNGSGTNTIQVTPYALGQFLGDEITTLTIAQMPAHHHTFINGSAVTDSPNDNNVYDGGGLGHRQPQTDDVGGSQPHTNFQPTTYMNVFIKL